jgi:type IV secretion system protein VirB6
MGLINTVSVQIDTILKTYVQDVFTIVSQPISILLKSVAMVALIFIAVNNVLQMKQINFSSYLHWGLRYGLVFSFATIWGNFSGIYGILHDIPSEYVALLMKTTTTHYLTHRTDVLDPSVIKDTTTAMDEFGHAIVWIAYDFLRDTSILNIGLSIRNVFIGALIIIIGGIFLASGAIIIIVGQVGFAVAISLAPLAIVMLMMEQTKSHFQSWMQFTVGFAVIPILVGALMSVVLYAASFILANSGADSQHKDLYFGFVMVMIAALVLLFMLPTMASTLASASVAAVGGGAAFAAASMAKGALMKTYNGGSYVKSMASTANNARKDGAGAGGVAMSVFRSMRQSSGQRSARRDERIGKGIRGDSKAPSPSPSSATPSRGGNSGGNSGHRLSPEQQNRHRT